MNASVDLRHYAGKILAEEDRPLFNDALEAGKAGALRAAYVMIWLSCAESLKRRFREAGERDGAAGKIVGKIKYKEEKHNAVDKFVLEEAHKYGFVSASGHAVLNHIYEMRCLYGHPYEEAPSQEQVSHAAAAVVEHVLSKPVKLRHGFGEQLLNSLQKKTNYLDDEPSAVFAFVKDIILPRLDESIYIWLLDRYWTELEEFSDDPSKAIFFRRGLWFSYAMLLEVGINIFPHDDWHNRINNKFPKFLMQLCSIDNIFKNIGEKAQNSLVGLIIAESASRPSVLTYLERLSINGTLTMRQQERFVEHVSEMPSSAIRSAGLSTKTCYGKLIDAMKSHNWYVQNPAIDLIVSNGPDQAAELDENQQVSLGRNLLQASQGEARSAEEFFEKLSKDGTFWPFHVVRGAALELFTNENNQLRFKIQCLPQVLSAIDHLPRDKQVELMEELAASVNAGTPKYGWSQLGWDLRNSVNLLEKYTWAAPLAASLKKKAEVSSVEERNI